MPSTINFHNFLSPSSTIYITPSITPSSSPTPSITSTPSSTATPTVSLTPSITPTPSTTPTPSPIQAGCADGTREAFTTLATFPNIAGCDGAWSVAGVTGNISPQCNNNAGNSGSNPSGSGCTIEDLCAVGWHVCTTVSDVVSNLPAIHPTCLTTDFNPGTFYVTQQSGLGNGGCDPTGDNDLFGCGSGGAGGGISPPNPDCSPLNEFSNNLCSALSASWNCGVDSNNEGANAVKTEGGGGALCCFI